MSATLLAALLALGCAPAAPVASAAMRPPPALAPLGQALDTGATLLRDAEARLAEQRRARARGRELRRLRASRSVRGALRRAWLSGAVDRAGYERWRAGWWRAQQTAERLSGVRAHELRAALQIVDELARRRLLTSTRLPLAMLTVERNRTQWATRSFPVPGRRMSFGRDPVVFLYVPGQGVQVHWLSTAGRVNGLARDCMWHGRPCRRDAVRRGLRRMEGLSSRRGGFVAWESLYRFGQGRGPWISAMTQATAIQALARGARVLRAPRFARFARRALGAFERRPPLGIAVAAPAGRAYLMYSFAPGLRILNGQLQALSGLHDLAVLSGSRRARRLFNAGDRVLRPALRSYDTGAWSLYAAGGLESNLGYHRLTSGFLGNLCRRTHRAAYCAEHQRLQAYERQAPRVAIARVVDARAGRRQTIVFALSKVSSVAVRVSGHGGSHLLSVAQLRRGIHRVPWTPGRGGRYELRVSATGLSGPHGVVTREVRVRSRPRRHHRTRRHPSHAGNASAAAGYNP